VHRMVQNFLHPRIKTYCLFESRPESIQELYSLATTVAETVAVEDQRKPLTASGSQGVARVLLSIVSLRIKGLRVGPIGGVSDGDVGFWVILPASALWERVMLKILQGRETPTALGSE
jgi:hypothetical protein